MNFHPPDGSIVHRKAARDAVCDKATHNVPSAPAGQANPAPRVRIAALAIRWRHWRFQQEGSRERQKASHLIWLAMHQKK
jgi:hypothetical protein